MTNQEQVTCTKEQLKLKEIDQLNLAILQFSKSTLTTKKVCASILIGVSGLILNITNNSLDTALFIGALITLSVFWIIDANSYYYQRKLRIRMNSIVHELSNPKSLIYGFGMPLKEDEKASWIKALFNWSQLFYLLGLFVVICILIANKLRWI